MKKTVLALAALAAVSTSALAQSSVSLYGVLDASLENLKGDDSVTRVSSDNLAISRFGVRGLEDLGGGLKAKFNLEAGVKVDTGASDSSAFWGSSAWVGIEGGFGELRLGRQESSIGLLAGNTSILGAQPYDDLKIAGTFSGETYRRVNNGITYILPTFVNGLSIQAQYSTRTSGEEIANDDTGQAYGFNVQYFAGPFGAGLGYINAKQNASGSNKAQGWLAFAAYDFGLAKLTGYYESDDSDAASVAATYDKREVIGVRVGVPFGSNFNLSAGVSKVSNVGFTQNNDATIVAVKGVYSLSKRTALYGLITNVSNDNGSRLAVAGSPASPSAAPVTSDRTSRGIAFGVRHQF
ncbi:MAG: porin [Pseudomonadota bacterium]